MRRLKRFLSSTREENHRLFMENPDSNSEISAEFAKKLLRVLYGLDKPIDELSLLCEDIQSEELRMKISDALGDVMRTVLTDLIVPIYRQHPELGRASEPGNWLYHDDDGDQEPV